ncbi:uncharacterized protein LOC130138498 [Syzygium oleosum]|uniref:uncharacterized protein LOC130138498 n=1 Tax=Syzygium oleosum TaxID=219896 RepID=UPI0024B8CE57|nr:uncharacterized protein LOC130138498 [Syzygium oleosum]
MYSNTTQVESQKMLRKSSSASRSAWSLLRTALASSKMEAKRKLVLTRRRMEEWKLRKSKGLTRAEEFIAKIYEQMKLQRQISYLQYNEMLNRSAS